MCFSRLPVAFDDNGKAYLKDESQNPYGYEVTPLAIEEDRLKELLARNGFIKSVDFDPVTRVAGALAFHSVVDLENKKVLVSQFDGDDFSRLRGYFAGARPQRRHLHLEPRLRGLWRGSRDSFCPRYRDGLRYQAAADGHYCAEHAAGH